MTATVVSTPEELQAVFTDVQTSFERIRFVEYLTQELRLLEQQHAGHFRLNEAPNQSPWVPLAPSTVRRKGHSTILVDTGRLKQSLINPSGADTIREVVDEQAGKGLAFGTSVPYSRFHDVGGGRLPRRPHVGFTERYLQGATDRLATHAVKELQNGQV